MNPPLIALNKLKVRQYIKVSYSTTTKTLSHTLGNFSKEKMFHTSKISQNILLSGASHLAVTNISKGKKKKKNSIQAAGKTQGHIQRYTICMMFPGIIQSAI